MGPASTWQGAAGEVKEGGWTNQPGKKGWLLPGRGGGGGSEGGGLDESTRLKKAVFYLAGSGGGGEGGGLDESTR